MTITDPDQPNRTHPRPCPSCGGSSAGCRSVEFLTGRHCCDQCDGNHNHQEQT